MNGTSHLRPFLHCRLLLVPSTWVTRRMRSTYPLMPPFRLPAYTGPAKQTSRTRAKLPIPGVVPQMLPRVWKLFGRSPLIIQAWAKIPTPGLVIGKLTGERYRMHTHIVLYHILFLVLYHLLFLPHHHVFHLVLQPPVPRARAKIPYSRSYPRKFHYVLLLGLSPPRPLRHHRCLRLLSRPATSVDKLTETTFFNPTPLTALLGAGRGPDADLVPWGGLALGTSKVYVEIRFAKLTNLFK